MADVVVTVTDNPLSRSVVLTIRSVESGDAVGEYVTRVTGYVYMYIVYMYVLHALLTHTLPPSHPHLHPHAPIFFPTHTLAHYPPPHQTLSLGGIDFTEVNHQATLISTFTLSLSILEDRDVEDDETFSLSLTTYDMGVNIMTDTTVITITDASEYCHIGVCGVMVAGGIQVVLVILMYVYTLGLDLDRLRAVMRANCCTVSQGTVVPCI